MLPHSLRPLWKHRLCFSQSRMHSNELSSTALTPGPGSTLLVGKRAEPGRPRVALSAGLHCDQNGCLLEECSPPPLILAEKQMVWGKELGKPAHFTKSVKGKRGVKPIGAQALVGGQLAAAVSLFPAKGRFQTAAAGHSEGEGISLRGWGWGWNTNSA